MAQNTPIHEPQVSMREKQEQGPSPYFKPNGLERTTITDSAGILLPQSKPPPFKPSHIEQEIPQGLRGASAVIVTSAPHQRRMSLFEPFSLPPSRAPSHEVNEHNITLGLQPPAASRTASPMHSPPLTPAATHDHLQARSIRSMEIRDKLSAAGSHTTDPAAITPQQSPPRSTTNNSMNDEGLYHPTVSASSSRPTSSHNKVGALSPQPHRPRPSFQIGPVESIPSREASPLGTPANRSPTNSGSTTPWNPPSRPFTPAGEIDDPYARSKRPPQNKNPQEIEARFIFGRNKDGTLTSNNGEAKSEKRHSHLSLHSLVKHKDSSSSIASGSKHSSMAELKRFFRPQKRSTSPTSSLRSSRSSTLPLSAPFGDDHGLQKRYGKFGRVLGSGAGGSVRLMKRSSDGVTFAVKEFRAKHNYESDREYAKKVTAEFCIGSTLHHGNIVETLDIVQEKGKWYEVMEYCPYDLFATVMTGKMSREEVACCFLQILNGVTYLHAMGLAHRDLKLDNVVINEHGILKIIDFGSASVFRYPFESGIVEACGIVGSDPYLAPEVCNEIKYDPQPADVWSLAIIFCCMSLRRFPWKAPRLSDKSFKLFCTRPDESQQTHSQTSALPTSKAHQQRPGTSSKASDTTTQTQGDHVHADESDHNQQNAHSSAAGRDGELKGPIRLLRLLPRESRNIIGRMLELDPKKRATIEEIWQDPWVSASQICRQDDDGTVHKCTNHTHTLEGQVGGSAQSSRKSTK